MLARNLTSFFKRSSRPQVSSVSKPGDEANSSSFVRKGISFVLITVTGGVALSALDDLLIYQSCASKAMEKASQNQAMKDAIGEPVAKGPWYNASLAVAHKRQTVSCTFPVSGPRGYGVLQLKAIRNGADNWASFFLPREWEILIMEALLHVPENDERHQAMRIKLLDNIQPDACTSCQLQESKKLEKTQTSYFHGVGGVWKAYIG